MDIKEVEKEYCSRCPSYKYGCGFITRGLQDKCVQLSGCGFITRGLQDKCVQLSDYVDGYERGYHQAEKDTIEKAAEWMENNLEGVVGGSIYIEDFLKAMNDE